MADYAVTTVFKSKDGVTGTFKKMGAGADKFGQRSRASFSTANRSALTFKKTLAAILSAGIIRRGFGMLQQGVRKVVTEFIAFDDAITAAAAKFDGIERGTKVFEELKATARDVGATTEFTSAQAAEGLRFLAKAGFEPAFAMKSLKSFVDLATASEMEFAEATDIATDVMGAFRLNAENTEVRMKNLIRVNDVMAKAVNMANIDMTDLFETIKLAGPVAVDAGVSLEKFTAIAAFIGGAGIKASQGGTALRTALLALTAKTPAATKVFRKLGIQLVDAEKNLRDPIKIFDDLRKKMEGMGNAQKSATLAVIFGKRAIAGASVSIAGGSKALGKFEKSLLDAGGESKRMADLMRQSLGKRLAALESGAIELGFKFLDAFEKKMPGAIDRATEAVRKFDMGPVIDSVKKFASRVSEGIKILRDLRPAIETVIIFTIAYKAALTAVVAIQAVKFFWDMTVALRAAGAAQGFLNAAMLANPIGVVVLAVAGLVTAGVMLYRQWDNIKFLWISLVSAVKDGIRRITGWFKETEFGKNWIAGLDIIIEKWKWLQRNVFRQKVETEKPITTAKTIRRAKIAALMEARRAREAAAAAATKPKLPSPKVPVGRRGFERAGVPARGRSPAVTPEGERRKPPNAAEIAAQNIRFRGKLTVAGAPPGSTLETETIGAPPVQTELLGPNV